MHGRGPAVLLPCCLWRSAAQTTPVLTTCVRPCVYVAWVCDVARSRLPKADNWDRPFKLTSKNGGDDILPLAHTCFFQIELPAYSSDEIMKQRLIAASTYGIGAFLMA